MSDSRSPTCQSTFPCKDKHGNEEFREKYLERKLKNDKIIEKLKIVTDMKIPISVNNIMGFPFETRELAFDTMVAAGIKEESAYYESLHETPLIANTIARKKLYEMNRIISDTAEYGCYLFNNSCIPLLTQFMNKIDTSLIGKPYTKNNQVKNQKLIAVNKAIRNHPIEIIGAKLRASMTAMK